jgi:hypothetical protein
MGALCSQWLVQWKGNNCQTLRISRRALCIRRHRAVRDERTVLITCKEAKIGSRFTVKSRRFRDPDSGQTLTRPVSADAGFFARASGRTRPMDRALPLYESHHLGLFALPRDRVH